MSFCYSVLDRHLKNLATASGLPLLAAEERTKEIESANVVAVVRGA